MDLDTVTQRFDGDASGFRDAIQQVKAGYGEYGEAAVQASQKAANSFAAIAPAAARSAAQIKAAFNAAIDEGVLAELEQIRISAGSSFEELATQARAAAEEIKAVFAQSVDAGVDAGVGAAQAEAFKALEESAQQAAAAVGRSQDAMAASMASAGRRGTASNDVLGRSFGTLHGSTRAVVRETAQFVEGLATGGVSARNFANQILQLASAIHPLAGLAVASAVAIFEIGKSILGVRDASDSVISPIQQINQMLSDLGENDKAIDKIAESMAKLSAEGQRAASIKLGFQLEDQTADLEKAKQQVLEISRLSQRQAAIRSQPVAERATGGVTDINVQPQIQQLSDLRNAIRANETELADAAAKLRDFAQYALTAFPDIAGQAQTVASSVARIQVELPNASPARATELRAQMDQQLDQLIDAIKAKVATISDIQLPSLGTAAAQALPQELIDNLNKAQKAFQDGTGSALDVVEALRAIGVAAKGSLPDLSRAADDAAERFAKLEAAADAAGVATSAAANRAENERRTQADPVLRIKAVLDYSDVQEQLAQRSREVAQRGIAAQPVPSAVTEATAALDTEAQRIQHLRQIGISESGIATVLKVQAQVKEQIAGSSGAITDAAAKTLGHEQDHLDALKAQTAEISKQAAARAALPGRIQDLQNQNAGAQMPTQELRDAATEAALLQANLADVHTPDDLMATLLAMPPAIRNSVAEIVRLKQEARTLQFGTQVQQLRNQNLAAAAGPGPTRIAAQALAAQNINIAPRGTPPITDQAAAIKAIHAAMDGLDEVTKRTTEDFIAQTEAAQQISLNEDLANQLAQVQQALRYAGQESEEYRIQARLLQIKLQTGKAVTDAQEAEVRQIEAGTTAIREQNFLLQQQQQRVDTQAKIRAAGNPADILSQQFLGTPSEQTRVEATTRETMRANPDMDPNVARDQAAQQEALNTQYAVTNELLPSIADSMAQIAQTSMTEGPEAAARQFLQTLSEMAIRLGILITLQTIFNALSAGAGGAGGAATVSRTSTQLTGAQAGAAFATAQAGGPVKRGQRTAVAEDSKAELFLPDSLRAQPLAAGLSSGAMAAATGIREPDVRSLSRSRGGQALMGLLAASGEQPTGARRGGVQLLGARGPQLFVPPEDGTVLNNQDLRRIEGSPSGRAMLRRLGRAAGGPVSGGQLYITGERQEELFLPDSVQGLTRLALPSLELTAPALPTVPVPRVAGSVVALPMAGSSPFHGLPLVEATSHASEIAAIVQAAVAGMAAEGVAAAPAALALGGPLKPGQPAVAGERGPELLLRGKLAEAVRAGRLEQAVARLDQVPRQDWPVVIGRQGQENIVSDRTAEVLNTDRFRRLASTPAGQRMLIQLGASAPPALVSATQPPPGPARGRRLGSGTTDGDDDGDALLGPGGPLRAGQPAIVGERGPELMLRGTLADAARTGRLEQALARLDQIPRQDLPVVLGARGQERVISNRSAEVLSTDNFRRLAVTRAGQRMLTQLGAAPPPALAVTQSKPGTDQIRRLATGTINTAQMLSGGASQRPQQIVVNNAPPEFRVIDQRPAGSPPIEQSSQTGADGRLVITAMVRSATAEMLRTGEHQSVMRNVYGITPRPRA